MKTLFVRGNGPRDGQGHLLSCRGTAKNRHIERHDKELPEDPVDGGDGGDGGGVAHPLGEQLLPDLPGKHPWKAG